MLLCDAVNGAHTPDEWFAVDWDHAASGEEALEGFGGARVVRVTKDGKQHHAVGDIKVCVAGGQALEVS